MTIQPDRQPARPGAEDPSDEPEEYAGLKLTGEQARRVRFILIMVAVTLLFSALAFLVILN